MTRLGLLLAGLLLGGCASLASPDLSGTAWWKMGGTIQEVTLDEMDCARAAREAGATPDLVVGGVVDIGRFTAESLQRQSAYRQCMTAKGYLPA